MERYIKVISFETKKTVHRMKVTDKTEREIEKIERGININLNHEKYYTTSN